MRQFRNSFQIVYEILNACLESSLLISHLVLKTQVSHNGLIPYINKLIKINCMEIEHRKTNYGMQKFYKITQEGIQFKDFISKWVNES